MVCDGIAGGIRSQVASPIKSEMGKKNTVKGYTIRQGDTLTSIAQKTGVSVSDIQKLNPGLKDPKKIQPGQVIQMPNNAMEDRRFAGRNYPTATGVGDFNTNDLWDKYQK